MCRISSLMTATEGPVAEFSSFANFEERKRKSNLLISCRKIVHRKGSFGFFRFCPPILNIFGSYTLKEIRKNKNIVILKPDKGNGVVVLDRSDYDQGILKIINDTSKFRLIREDPTSSREGRLQSLSMFRKFMVSFDVESLFTNIPLEECINLAVNYISEGNPDVKDVRAKIF